MRHSVRHTQYCATPWQRFPLTVYTEHVYVRPMLRRTNIYLDSKILKELEAIGKPLGLKVAQVVRLALSEFVKARKEGKQ